ncbi:MAG: hypothetical protein WBB01_15720 [Phormidesmis sp.]
MPKNIAVKCPQCQRIYIDWYTPAINPQTDSGPSTICSKCGHRSQLGDLTEKGGVFQQLNSSN